MGSFKANRAGINALGRSVQIQRAMGAQAGKVKTRAEVIAPVDTGLYKASFVVASGVAGGKAYGRVSNEARNPRTGFNYPVALEFGNSRIKRQRILGRALDAIRD